MRKVAHPVSAAKKQYSSTHSFLHFLFKHLDISKARPISNTAFALVFIDSVCYDFSIPTKHQDSDMKIWPYKEEDWPPDPYDG
jgi:hypothetical protein